MLRLICCSFKEWYRIQTDLSRLLLCELPLSHPRGCMGGGHTPLTVSNPVQFGRGWIICTWHIKVSHPGNREAKNTIWPSTGHPSRSIRPPQKPGMPCSHHITVAIKIITTTVSVRVTDSYDGAWLGLVELNMAEVAEMKIDATFQPGKFRQIPCE